MTTLRADLLPAIFKPPREQLQQPFFHIFQTNRVGDKVARTQIGQSTPAPRFGYLVNKGLFASWVCSGKATQGNPMGGKIVPCGKRFAADQGARVEPSLWGSRAKRASPARGRRVRAK